MAAYVNQVEVMINDLLRINLNDATKGPEQPAMQVAVLCMHKEFGKILAEQILECIRRHDAENEAYLISGNSYSNPS